MKNIFTFLVFLVVTTTGFAADRFKTKVTIFTYNAGSMRVVLNGKVFDTYRSSLSIMDVPYGQQRLMIYRKVNGGIFSRPRFELISRTGFFLERKDNILIQVDRYGRANVIDLNRKGGWNDREFKNKDFDNDRNVDGVYYERGQYDRSLDNDVPAIDRNNDVYGNPTDDRRGNNNGNVYDNRNNNGGYDNRNSDYRFNAMSSPDFDRAIYSIEKEWLDSKKFKMVNDIIAINYFTATQVKRLMNTVTNESQKLDIAKQAFEKTLDKDNYQIVNDEFKYRTSKDELEEFMKYKR